ncbi:2-dehydro-3-deoxygalactonokinase [Marinomonas agarivorans]|nr:2-dehydro-3-deoxygalactonokinase [Marinomonas agarivorans]
MSINSQTEIKPTELTNPLCIAVDWGTSNLRAYLLDQNGKIHDQRESDKGILNVAPNQYENVLIDFVGDWFADGVPVLMAGMVGSRTGWQEVPYQNCPVTLDDLSQHLVWLQTNLPGPVAIVPGLQGRGLSGCNDIMRGEETQLVGVMDLLQEQGLQDDVLCCLPGTHCKWVRIENGQIHQFSTTFSGEFFAQINTDSSLTRGLPQSQTFDKAAFEKGLHTSQQQGGLLHHLFSARSNYINEEIKAEQVRDYLSGIIIGHDVNGMLSALDQKQQHQDKVYLVGSKKLCERYACALDVAGVDHEFIDASDATIRGLKRLAAKSE